MFRLQGAEQAAGPGGVQLGAELAQHVPEQAVFVCAVDRPVDVGIARRIELLQRVGGQALRGDADIGVAGQHDVLPTAPPGVLQIDTAGRVQDVDENAAGELGRIARIAHQQAGGVGMSARAHHGALVGAEVVDVGGAGLEELLLRVAVVLLDVQRRGAALVAVQTHRTQHGAERMAGRRTGRGLGSLEGHITDRGPGLDRTQHRVGRHRAVVVIIVSAAGGQDQAHAHRDGQHGLLRTDRCVLHRCPWV